MYYLAILRRALILPFDKLLHDDTFNLCLNLLDVVCNAILVVVIVVVAIAIASFVLVILVFIFILVLGVGSILVGLATSFDPGRDDKNDSLW
jgi:hypothetical protein